MNAESPFLVSVCRSKTAWLNFPIGGRHPCFPLRIKESPAIEQTLRNEIHNFYLTTVSYLTSSIYLGIFLQYSGSFERPLVSFQITYCTCNKLKLA